MARLSEWSIWLNCSRVYVGNIHVNIYIEIYIRDDMGLRV